MTLAALLWGQGITAESLTVVSWGGAYEHSQIKAYFEPFTRQTGIPITIRRYDGGIGELRRQVTSGTVTWDLVDLVIADNMEACEQGLLEPLDHAALAPSPDGVPAAEDFIEGALTECGVTQIVSATVLAYDAAAFPGEKPSSIEALFDLERFPGKRALQKKPIANLEWALLSYGVPRQDIYHLLSTARGLRLAFARLDSIKEHIVWWTEGSTPPRLLARGEVVMASGYNGRFFNAAVVQGHPIDIIWDGQLYDHSTWGIPRGAPNREAALRFIRFATATQPLADQAKYIPYGPARRSSARRVWRHEPSGIDIRPHLPTYPTNFRQAIRKDHEWYARIQSRLNVLFRAWLAE